MNKKYVFIYLTNLLLVLYYIGLYSFIYEIIEGTNVYISIYEGNYVYNI